MSQRLFLGFKLDEDSLEKLSQFQENQILHKGIRWVPESNLHITVLFLGNVLDEQMPNLLEMIRVVAGQWQSFVLEFRDYCFAPSGKSPRMIWARYHKTKSFRELVHRLHQLYDQIEPQKPMRNSPVPHVTLARLRDFQDFDQIHLKHGKSLKHLKIDRLHLWESHLNPDGAEYEWIQSFEMGQ